jgi:glycine cleavage system H protein
MAALFVVATVLAFLGVDLIIRRRIARNRGQASMGLSVRAHSFLLRLPEGVFFARSHTWLNLFPSGKARLGVDDFIANLFEKAEVTLVKSAGDHVEMGEPMLVLSEHGRALTVRAPISGEIISINEKLEERRGLKRAGQFSDGWAYTMKPGEPAQLRRLMLGSESRSWMSAEMCRLRDFFTNTISYGMPSPVLQDGGAPARGALLTLGTEDWKRFERQFLQEDIVLGSQQSETAIS